MNVYMPSSVMELLYVLELADDCWYVGKTKDLDTRFARHLAGTGAEWTKLHPPKVIVEAREVTSSLDEDHVTKQLMMKYGVDKVRGGSYSQTVLSAEQLKLLTIEFRTGTNGCFKCGGDGHFAKNCRQASAPRCDRCGRTSHVTSRCYAQTHKSGERIEPVDRAGERIGPMTGTEWMKCVQCGEQGHGGLVYCPAKSTWIWSRPVDIAIDATVGRCPDCGDMIHGPLGKCPVTGIPGKPSSDPPPPSSSCLIM